MISMPIRRNLLPPTLSLWSPELPPALFRQHFIEKAGISDLLVHLSLWCQAFIYVYIQESYQACWSIVNQLFTNTVFDQRVYRKKFSSLHSQYPD